MISLYMFYFVLLELRYRKKTSRSWKRSAARIKGKKRKGKNVITKSKTKQRKNVQRKTHTTRPLSHWIIDPVKLLHFEHFSLPYTLFEACRAVFITHSKITLRKISLNEYFNTILHYSGVNLLLGRHSSLLAIFVGATRNANSDRLINLAFTTNYNTQFILFISRPRSSLPRRRS